MMQRLRTVRPIISGFVALVSCPCHLPLTLPLVLSLTAGTAFGVWLVAHIPIVVAISVVVFMGSLLFTLRWSGQRSILVSVGQ